MTIWVDAHLSPRTARWIAANFPVAAAPLRDIGLHNADDEDIFAAARAANAIVLTTESRAKPPGGGTNPAPPLVPPLRG